MANKTIPELDEIEIGDLADTNLTLWETAIQTYKIRISTMIAFFREKSRTEVEVVLAGSETGIQTIDVAAYEIGATKMIWELRDADGWQLPSVRVRASDDETIEIDLGDWTMEAGTYTLLGV